MRGLDFLVECFQAFELRGEAAFRGRVDYEDDFVLEVGERVGLAFFCAGEERDVSKAGCAVEMYVKEEDATYCQEA